MARASIGSAKRARRREIKERTGGDRFSRRGRAGSAFGNANRRPAETVPRAIPDRAAKSFRSGPASPQHCPDDSGEGLRRPSPGYPAALLDQMVKGARARPNGRLDLPQRIKPGSELVRTWNRRTYRVTVMTDGFAYGGTTFASLSEIANAITGTRWNGPRFFGLRSAGGQENTDGE
jgi:hypothetical protein